ncbi:MAG: hypothetical protein QXQ53_07580, partial [Candidatus Methanosuratincola sp.]
ARWNRTHDGELLIRWSCAGNWVVAGSPSPQMEAQCYQRIFIVARAVYRSPEFSLTPTPNPTPSPEEWWDLPPGSGWGISWTIPISSIVDYIDIPGGCLTIPGGFDIPGALAQALNALGLGIPERISWMESDLTVCLTRRLVTVVRPYPGSQNFAPVLGGLAAAVMVGVVYSVIRRR